MQTIIYLKYSINLKVSSILKFWNLCCNVLLFCFMVYDT